MLIFMIFEKSCCFFIPSKFDPFFTIFCRSLLNMLRNITLKNQKFHSLENILQSSLRFMLSQQITRHEYVCKYLQVRDLQALVQNIHVLTLKQTLFSILLFTFFGSLWPFLSQILPYFIYIVLYIKRAPAVTKTFTLRVITREPSVL